MMLRKLFATVTVLALALCAGRVAAYASPTADAHACCHAQKASTPKAVLVDCCPIAAAVTAPSLTDPLFAIMPHSAPSAVTVAVLIAPLPVPTSPPGPRTYRAASPARAPPLV